MSFREQLTALAESGRYCTVKRSLTEDARHSGYVVSVGAEHFAMEQFHDFYSEGISIFPIEYLIEVLVNERDDLFHRAIENEGLRCKLPPLEALGSFVAVLRWAYEQGETLIIQEESVFAEDSDYSVGRITALDDETIELAYLDSKGHWDLGEIEIEIEDVTRLDILTPYCTMFAKYCDPFRMPESEGRP